MKTIPALILLLSLAHSLPAEDNPTIIRLKGRPVVDYWHDAVAFKPYVAQLYTAGGVAVLRDNVPDHKHHHGLMFAVGVNGVNFWEELHTAGRQVSRKLATHDDGITQQLDWTGPNGPVLLSEERSVRSHPGPVTVLTWRSRLQPNGEVKLTGSHYFGLGLRFAATMDRIGTFTNSANARVDVVQGDERLVTAKWCAYTDQKVTVALFDHPDNLRYPARMFTMAKPFAYLSATLNLWKEPFTLKPEKPLDLRYGVAAWDGAQTAEQIEQLYRSWLEETSHSE